MKFYTYRQFCRLVKPVSKEEYIVEMYKSNNALLFVDNCPTEVTEDGDCTMYSPNGKVYFKGVEVRFDNPVFIFEGEEIAVDLLAIAKATNKDVLLFTERA